MTIVSQAASISFPIKVQPALRVPIFYSIVAVTLLVTKFVALSSVLFLDDIWRFLVAGLVVILGLTFLKRVKTSYSLDALEVTEHTGVIFHKVRRIPLNRITNYETQSNIIERCLGLSRLAIDTPGGYGFEMILKEIPREQLRYLMNALSVLLGEQKIIDAGDDTALTERRQTALQAKVTSIDDAAAPGK